MKKITLAVAAMLAIGAVAIAQQEKSAEGNMPPKQEGKMMEHHHGHQPCEMMKVLKDAKLAVKNTEHGVTVEITVEDAAMVKKLQEVVAAHVKDGKFACPCKMHEGKHEGKHDMKECPMKNDKKADKDAPSKPEEMPAAK